MNNDDMIRPLYRVTYVCGDAKQVYVDSEWFTWDVAQARKKLAEKESDGAQVRYFVEKI
jgi:hypothetical protein